MSDVRVNYITSCIQSYLRLGSVPGTPLITSFLDSSEFSTLQVLYDTEFHYRLDLQQPPQNCKEVHFIKLCPRPLTEAELTTQVIIGSLGLDSLSSLYRSLTAVSVPLIKSGKIDPRLQLVLEDLLGGLSYSLKENSGEKLSCILAPLDEIEYWNNQSNDYRSDKQEQGKVLMEHYNKIIQGWTNFNSIEFAEFYELIENTGEALENIWKEDRINYPQPRMERMLNVVADSIPRKIQVNIGNLWEEEIGNVISKLNEGLKTVQRWIQIMQTIPNSYKKKKKWQGKEISVQNLIDFQTRVEEIIEIKSQMDELLNLLTPENQKRFKLDKIFEPLKRVNPFQVSDYSKALWEDGKSRYNANIQGPEEIIAGEIRKQLLQSSDTNYQLRYVQTCKGLINRPNIKKALQSEREQLQTQLLIYCENLKQEFDQKAVQTGGFALNFDKIIQENMSPIISSIIWSRQLSQKLNRVYNNSEWLLSDLENFKRIRGFKEILGKKIDDFQKQSFMAWSSGIEKAISDKNDPLALDITGKLMDLDLTEGVLKVGFSDKLVQLIKEVRQLLEYGFDIPKNIKTIASEAKKYCKEAITLKQVANFYNNMSSQILESQKRMLLGEALAFEEVVKSTKNLQNGKLTWNSSNEVSDYIKLVQKAANDLMTENRRLRKVHFEILEKIKDLQGIDLLKFRQMWKDKLNEIRRNIDSVSENKDPQGLLIWKTSLDKELYKALEIQYKLGLENLSQNLPDIKIDLAFINKSLQFRPPLEEIRSKYYSEIRMFISIPINFQGFGGNSDIYRKMPDKSSELLYNVYKKAEYLFTELKELCNSYKHWCVLGRVNIENLVEEKIKTIADFDYNFKALRQKRKDIEKIPDGHKIDCFNISTTPLKSALEDHLQRLSDALVLSLKTTVKFDTETLSEFLKNAQAKLNQRPETVEEITIAQKEILEIVSQKDKMLIIYDSIQEKIKNLKQITGNSPNIIRITEKWEGFLNSVETFKDTIEQQREVVKKDIIKRAEDTAIAIQKFEARWNALKPKPLEELQMETAIENSERIKEWREDWNSLKERVKALNEEAEHFNVTTNKFDLKKIDQELAEQTESWKIFEDFREELKKLSEEDWLSFRSKLYLFQEFFVAWSEKLKNRNKEVVSRFITSQIELYKRAWPLLKLSTGEGFEKEHWKSLFHYMKLGKEVTMENLKLSHFIDSIAYVIASADQIKELQARSQGEVTIREAIQELRVWCDEATFSLFEHVQNERVTPLIKEWKELLTQVSDNQSLLSSLKESRFFARFSDQVGQFESKLSSLDEYLFKLAIIQRKWVYLEPIFGRGSLPQEQGRFKRIDDEYRNIMLGIGMDSKVISLCNIPGLKDTLDTLIDQLERCQKALNDFLEEKRSKFPRFYFIGDDDLLEILGQAKNPTVIQTHLKKLFSGIYRVEFGENNNKIVAFLSSANERVELHNSIKIVDEVEVWLDMLSREMKNTLSNELITCLKSNNIQSILTTKPSQLCSLSEVIVFSENCVKALESGGLNKLKTDLQKKLSDLSTSRQSDNLILIKVKSLILDLIHNIEVVDVLIQSKASNVHDWEWHRQLKFFLNQNVCVIKMVEAVFNYTYEYQGNAPKLVHTPLTDKCYLTLTQGMMMGYGGNPYGPAGTGKTESVKALGQAFGRQVLVFNCDEGIDFKSMGRIFIGLVKCGAWGCFDEFNRLLEEQLSAISQQIQVIQKAIKNSEKTLELLGRVIDVNMNAGIFVTMNPAGKGYGGRSKLPDNLKMLFRPVAMSVPDNELIAEVLLFSEGFQSAKSLSKKLVELFLLARQLLSSQQHYDWGLRALKTTLTVGGQIIQAERAFNSSLDPEREAVILIKAIRINTLPKLTYSDLQKFTPLVNDIFIGTIAEDIKYAELEEAIKKTLEELKLEYSENQVSKILQFYESTMQRMGVVLVGPSGCGKSTIWKVLKSALLKLNKHIMTYVMNPKSMPRQQLLGHMDNDSREWNEGVLTSAARECVKQQLEVRSWIICDGDIDPEWIESLNSVLDDNHLLTLPTGERISFADNVNFIFETNDLRYASPATVSRMGMIFMSEEDVDIRRLITSWLKKQSADDSMKMERWVEEILMPGLEWALLNNEEMVVKTTKVGVVISALSMLSGIKNKIEFVYAVIRGIGSNFKAEYRNRLANEVFSRAKETPPDPRYPLDCFYSEKTGNLRPFVSENENFDPSDFKDIYEPPVVRTIGIQRDTETFKTWLENGQPFIVVGPEGCGKNLMLKNAFKQLKSTQVAVLNCNAQTSSNHVIQKLLQVCMQSTSTQGKVLRPKETSRLILYLKDINLPTPDKYNTIQVIALLQQLVTYQGFYDGLEFVSLERVQIVASMNPSSTVGRHALSPRFTAIVRIVSIDYPTRDELIHIYTIYLKNILRLPGLGNNTNSAPKLAACMVELFSTIKNKFTIDEYKHYLFTPRDITLWAVSLLRYEAKNPSQLYEVWGYEASRIFKDRMVLGKNNKNHVRVFEGLLADKLRQDLGYSEAINCFYTTWSATHEGSGPPMGRVSAENLETIMKQGLLAYEREYRELHMHIFQESLLNIAIANRILSRPGGCMLLVGESGIGRRNVSLLASHMLNLTFISFNITRDYSTKEFRRDLKSILQISGIEGKPTSMFIEDYQLVNTEFLQLLNSLLSSGEVPGLYTSDEIEPLLINLADEMKQAGGYKSLYEFFVARVRNNLRIILSLDYSHPMYEINCANNPALYTRCSVVWMKQWSEPSLNAITQIEIQEYINDIPDKQDIIKLSIQMHSTVQSAVLRNFIDLLKTFRKIYSLKTSSQGGQSSHLKAGLDKLKEGN
jgi:dynein heavy chain 2, cytosolic